MGGRPAGRLVVFSGRIWHLFPTNYLLLCRTWLTHLCRTSHPPRRHHSARAICWAYAAPKHPSTRFGYQHAHRLRVAHSHSFAPTRASSTHTHIQDGRTHHGAHSHNAPRASSHCLRHQKCLHNTHTESSRFTLTKKIIPLHSKIVRSDTAFPRRQNGFFSHGLGIHYTNGGNSGHRSLRHEALKSLAANAFRENLLLGSIVGFCFAWARRLITVVS